MGNFLQIHFLSLSFDIAIIEEIPSEVEGLKEEEGNNQKKKLGLPFYVVNNLPVRNLQLCILKLFPLHGSLN